MWPTRWRALLCGSLIRRRQWSVLFLHPIDHLINFFCLINYNPWIKKYHKLAHQKQFFIIPFEDNLKNCKREREQWTLESNASTGRHCYFRWEKFAIRRQVPRPKAKIFQTTYLVTSASRQLARLIIILLVRKRRKSDPEPAPGTTCFHVAKRGARSGREENKNEVERETEEGKKIAVVSLFTLKSLIGAILPVSSAN